jgi:hypothetical protein
VVRVVDPVELVPLLVVALVMLSASGADVGHLEVTAEGDRTVTDVEDVLLVGGGTVTVPADERVNGSIYVIGGDARVAGTVDGDVVHLAGDLSLTDSAVVTGELGLYGGQRTVSDGARAGSVTDVPGSVTQRRSLADRLGFLLFQVVVVGAAGWLLARRSPSLLATVGAAATEHALVGGTVGLLAAASGLAMVVFMALTVVLLPVSLLALVAAVLLVGYVYVVLGYLVGEAVPVDDEALATVVGAAGVVVAMELLGLVPLVGSLLQLGVLVTGVGAVLITYFGLRRFEPVAFPE